jgi:hypothetical protein
MGCDYYILKVLHIYYNENDYLELELERQRGYYHYDYDEDEDDYNTKVDEYIKYVLTPEMKPINIYTNNNFNKPLFETKYKTLLENELSTYGKNWCEITKIIKVEERFERS